jgi:hypothetical protein
VKVFGAVDFFPMTAIMDESAGTVNDKCVRPQ